jgi:hypothetical protein
MSESDPALRPGGPASPDIGAAYVAIGIPQGIVVDPASGEIAGAVRRGGELVSLDPAEYALWALLLRPMTPAAATEAASDHDRGRVDLAIARLEELNLLITIELREAMGEALARLRPIPLGFGLGNYAGDPGIFEIQNATLSLPSPVLLDVVAIMFWWEFDSTRSLREIAAHVASRLPSLSLDRAHTVATQLAYGMMANRLLYLDSPILSRGE